MSSRHSSLEEQLSGVNAVLTTPFTPDRDLDERALRSKVEYVLKAGLMEEAGGLVVLGSVGECVSLTPEEQRRVIRIAVEVVDGRVPVVAGVIQAGTRPAIEMSQRAFEAGCDAVMNITPYYYPPSPAAVQRHYELLADAIDGGIVLYNNFVVSGLDVPTSVIAELAERDEVVAIKEPTLNTAKLEQVVQRAGGDLAALNGNGAPFEPQGYVVGSEGFFSTLANFAPEVVLEIARLGRAGRYEDLSEIKRRNIAPIAAELHTLDAEKAPAALKYLEDQVGAPGGGPVRSPHASLSETDADRMGDALSETDLVDAA